MLDVTAAHMDAIKQAYQTPPRAYHSFAHIEEVRANYDRIPWQRPDEVLVAVLYHDIIYVAGRADNETQSAELAKRDCARFWPALDATWIERLIILTASHGKLERDALNEDERLFLDCDMAILGADWPRFQLYDKQIAEEFVRVPRLVYNVGRKRFLKRLLASEFIYLSDRFRAELETRAKANLKKLLER